MACNGEMTGDEYSMYVNLELTTKQMGTVIIKYKENFKHLDEGK